MELLCDFHIHTALSPCAENDMTPNNIVNMAALCGLNAIAVTDHNNSGNAEAVMKAASKLDPPLTVLPGMEAESMEEVHIVCLFAALDDSDKFGQWIEQGMSGIKNNPDIFGDQLFMDENDQVTGTYEPLLVTATAYSIDEIIAKAVELGGAAYPAHIDRESNGILAVLGFIPPELGVKTVEVSKNASDEFLNRDDIKIYRKINASDAHRLWEIGEHPYELKCKGGTARDIILFLRENL